MVDNKEDSKVPLETPARDAFNNWICMYCSKQFRYKVDALEHERSCWTAIKKVEEVTEKLKEGVKEKAKTDKLEFSLTEIPLEALKRLGQRFKKGEEHYGRGNWRKGVGAKEWQIERANHALHHLLIYTFWLETGEYLGEIQENGERDDDLGAVGWFYAIQVEIERLEGVKREEEVMPKIPQFISKLQGNFKIVEEKLGFKPEVVYLCRECEKKLSEDLGRISKLFGKAIVVDAWREVEGKENVEMCLGCNKDETYLIKV